MQYFLGLERFNDEKPPFDPSLMVHFRKRLGPDILMEVNELIAKEAALKSMEKEKDDDNDKDSGNGVSDSNNETTKTTKKKNQDRLILDAACAPSDIHYPTDFRLLNEAREKLENIIDTCHEPDIEKKQKTRTYREQARKAYLAIEKKRKKSKKSIRKAIRKQHNHQKTLPATTIHISKQGASNRRSNC